MALFVFALILGCIVSSTSEPSIEAAETGAFLHYKDLGGKPYTVTADERSWIINGKRTLLLGGSVHYPRLSPGQWKNILTKMVNDGLNEAEVYVFWNLHEPQYDFSGKHTYNYDGRANLPGFLEMAKQVGIFVNLRIGPYVCAEWSFGGLPTWLLHVPGIEFRADNKPWETYMQQFVEEIANISQPYLAKNGGPIIMAQIENEYHGSQAYVNWCGNLVKTLDMNVSWVMCNGMSASDTINTCNGNNCYNYAKGHSKNFAGQPMGWTENEGWFQDWTTAYNPDQTNWGNRSPQDMAYVIALWFGAGAAHHNYYMWYGGNHVSWTAGSGIANYYADGVNYHADGLPHEPKRSHLAILHQILGDKQYILLYDDIQYGNEIHLNTTNSSTIDGYMYISQCINSETAQIWQYNASTKLLYNDYLMKNCIFSSGKSNPMGTKLCNLNDKSQQFDYNINQQFVSVQYGTCLDIDHKTGSIDEYSCKNSSKNNQQFKIDINTNTIHAVQNNSNCLTLKQYNNVDYNLF
eukprot:451348_1